MMIIIRACTAGRARAVRARAGRAPAGSAPAGRAQAVRAPAGRSAEVPIWHNMSLYDLYPGE